MTAAGSMSSEPLFYYPTLEVGDEIVLAGDEANHVKAQRLRVGAPIALFDGHGLIVRGTVQAITRRDVRVAVTERRREPARIPQVTLYCAVPKGDRVSTLLDMATQLGMHCFTPLRWRHAVVAPGANSNARWQRICIEACKQSHRLHAPDIAAPMALDQATAEAHRSGACLIVAHPRSGLSPIRVPGLTEAAQIALFVGPEGGLTNAEIRTLKDAGAYFVDLGDAVLRTETAAVALFAAVNAVANGNVSSPD